MHPIGESFNNVPGFYAERENSLDMVYLGGSACYRYWNPLQAFESEGIASYNLATSSIQPEFYELLIKEIYKTQKPKLIIIDARAFQYRAVETPTEVAYRYVLTGMPLSRNKIDFIQNNVKKYLGQDEISYYFDIIKYHRDTKNEKINDQIKMAFKKYENDAKGFYPRQKIEKKPIVEKYNTNVKMPISDVSEEILMNLLRYIKTTDCQYLFIVSPYMETEEHKENFNYIEEIIHNYGYDFLDCNDYYEEMQIDFSTDFFDDAHVNILGAEKYTDFLLEYLKQNYSLPDRRDEYQDWVNLLPKWNEQYNIMKEATQKSISQ